jgi:hypothetical protein
MLERFLRVSRRAVFGAAVAGALTVGAAGATTFHRLAVTQTTGSEGATTYLQTGASSSALQGEVGSSSANTSIKIPFGLLGEYDASGNTFGIGTLGISTTGYGVAAESFGGSPSLIALAGGTTAAINAVSSAASNGYPFESDADNGADGADIYSAGGTGIFVSTKDSTGNDSSQGIDVMNESLYSSAIAANNFQASPPPELDAGGGVYTSAIGPGVFARSSYDPPLSGEMDCGIYNDSRGADNGLEGQTCAGLYLVQSTTAGWPILIYNSSSQTYPFYVDADGNVTISGSLTQNASAKQRTVGTDELAYTAKQTENTIEDFGTAQLRNGGADVPLQADFRATMNLSKPYMVFLTPHGDNRGLYVASTSPQGFSIRESQGGRSTLAFDYRIVARPAGAESARLPREAHLARSAPHRVLGTPMSLAAMHTWELNRPQSHPKAHNPRRHAPTSLWSIPRR